MRPRAKQNVDLANALYDHLMSSGGLPKELCQHVSTGLADVVTSSQAVAEAVQQLLQQPLAKSTNPRSSVLLATIEAYLFTDVLERAIQLREVWEQLYDGVCRMQDENGLNEGRDDEE
jgi:predicted nucleic acid-binding protein